MKKYLLPFFLLFPLALWANQHQAISPELHGQNVTIEPISDETSEPADAPILPLLDKINFQGFISAAGAITNAKPVPSTTVAGNLNYPLYFGIGRNLSFESDSLAGMQLTAPISDKVEAILQIVARAYPLVTTVSKYELNANWAYLKYQPFDSLSIKAGRILVPMYLLSQYFDIAYAYPWLKPPQEVYGTLPVPPANGVIASWVADLASDWQLELEPFVFASNGSLSIASNSVSLQLKNYLGIAGALSNHDLTLRAVYLAGEALFNNGNPITFATTPVVLQLPSFNTVASYFSVGLRYDKDNILLLSEYARRNSPNSYLPDSIAWYVTGGYRFGKWMPLLTYAELKTAHNDRISQIPAALRTTMSNAIVLQQRSAEVGVRYDYSQNIALKASVTRVEPLGGTRGLFNHRPNQKYVNVFNFGVNAVF